jgi:hypothetical protein
MTKASSSLPAMIDITDLQTADTAELDIKHPITGLSLGWAWLIAGPGHPQTLANIERLQRQALAEQRRRDQARINGKKWKGDDKDPDEIRAENAANVAARIIGFPNARINGEELVFSQDKVVEIFLNQKLSWIYAQVLEFLTDDAAFFPDSAKS